MKVGKMQVHSAVWKQFGQGRLGTGRAREAAAFVAGNRKRFISQTPEFLLLSVILYNVLIKYLQQFAKL